MAAPRPRYGWYGDDFTGATDTLATVAAAGLAAMLFLGVPGPAELATAGPLDAIGIAGAARSMTPELMAEELEPVGRFFAALDVSVLHYKCCSTFDSAPQVGSIGAAIRCLRHHVGGGLVPIVGGQPNIGRYCAFSTLFAAAGAGGALYRLDRHPTMANHPVTPMHEADLRRHLEAQGLGRVAAVQVPEYERGLAQLEAQLDLIAVDSEAVLLDVTRQGDLKLIGELIWHRAVMRPLLAVGPSSVAQSLIAHWAPSPSPVTSTGLAPADGPILAVIGSLSPVSRAQVAASTSFEHLELSVDALEEGSAAARDSVGQAIAMLRRGRPVMVRTAPNPATGEAGQVAQATARFVRDVTAEVCPARIGIAGGDTSSHAALALGGWGLSYLNTLDPGVTLCRIHGGLAGLDGTELMLKGGQMGRPDLFERLLHGYQDPA